MKEMWLWFLCQEDLPEKEMATHCRVLSWEIPWTEEPGGLQFMGLKMSWIWLVTKITAMKTKWKELIRWQYNMKFLFSKSNQTSSQNLSRPCYVIIQFSSVQWLSHVWVFETPWAAACQASLFFTNSWSLCKLMSIKSVMPSNHLILCCPLLLPPSIFPNIRVFSNELGLCTR